MEVYDRDDNLIQYEHVVLGKCHGFMLCKRGPDDNHVCVQPIAHDDGNWFVTAGSFSSYWMEEYIHLTQNVRDWLKMNCDPNKDDDGHVWGYTFRYPKTR